MPNIITILQISSEALKLSSSREKFVLDPELTSIVQNALVYQ